MQKNRYLDKNVENIGFLDIETKTDSFKASSGYMMSWVLKKWNLVTNKKEIIEGWVDSEILTDKKRRKKLDMDKEILPPLVSAMKECDLIVTHYGTWFDIPFIRTRCEMMKIPFIEHSDKIRFADTWKLAKLQGSYKSNSLDFVAKTLGCPYVKTIVDYSEWELFNVFGERKSGKYILKHNEIDVDVTEWVWKKLEKYAPISARYY